ncbi:MAG: DUF4147 domain-containing protein [Dehalococcoidia bacterium]|jgi:glycerate-2-kinase|nr:DUF4147 domain-containing protein [Dehalococcoidia bacterium]
MQKGSVADKLLSLFRDSVLPLADAYLATRRAFHWLPEAEALVAADRRYPLKDIRRIYLVGAGKAGVPMARAVVDTLLEDSRLRDRLAGGAVNVYRDQAKTTIPGVTLFGADHPNPNEASVAGARAALALLSRAGKRDLVVAVISGGGSSLLELPQDGICLDDFRATNRVLVTGGPTIQEINTVRKRLSLVKGGRLRLAAPDAEFVTLVLSDVIGDDLSSIASGPTVPDATTCHDAVEVLERHHLWERIPESSRTCLSRGDPAEVERARLWRESLLEHTHSVVVASNAVVLSSLRRLLASAECARAFPRVWVEDTPVTGSVDQAVAQHHSRALQLSGADGGRALLVFGGEPVVKVPADASGTGGRMLHYALLASLSIADTGWTVLAAGTDGIDGTSPAAGAVITGETVPLAESHGLSPARYLAAFDSFGFFKELESRTGRRSLVVTGPTGTNVNDIMLWSF